MNIRSLVLGAAALAALTAMPVRAEEMPKPPSPSPELAKVAYFVGSWTCTGQAEASPFGPAHPTEATVHIRKDLGGFWQTGRYEEKKTAQNPQPMIFEMVWGYDAASKAFFVDGYDAFGNRSHEKSSGWKDNVLVFEGDTMGDGPAIPSRDTFTKKSDAVLEHFAEMQMDGKWLRLDHETCKRGGK
jgi:hypothetical protein